MTRQKLTIVCLIAAVVALGYFGIENQRLDAQAKVTAARTAVGVVSVNDLIAKSQKNIDFQDKIQKRRASLQAEAEKKQAEINLMRNDLDVIPDPAEKAKKQSEIIQAIANFQAWNQVQQQFLVRDQQSFLAELYSEITTTVASIAQREGYDMVLLDPPTPNFANLNAEQLVQVIGGRQVIYRANKVDLTALVLAQMDQNFRNRPAE